MSDRIIVLRTVVRATLALGLGGGLVFSLYLLLTQLNTPTPNAALTSLLGGAIGALGTTLGIIVQAIASNPSDRADG